MSDVIRTFEEILDEHCADPGRWEQEMQEGLLSENEYMVYRLSRAGLSEGEIADILNIKVGTVRGKKGRIRRKFEQMRRTQEIVENWGEL